ncbi:MAG: response regulator [Verrucomicrobiia bacterium]|jgi:DNA-binding response OmpR family regulator/phosphotransferase system IIB component
MNGTEKKILFVEDDPVVLTLYRNRLQREGFEVLFAEDGEVALSILSRVRPDLVVLDLMLPKVNGVDVLKHIRGDDRLKSTPVLILSNAYMTELAQKAMQSGANKGMLKTECTPAKLVEAIRDMLGYDPSFGLVAGRSGKSQAEAFVAAAAAAHADEMTLKATREEFIKDAPAEVAKIRDHCLAYIKSATTPAGLQQLNNLYQRVHFLTARAGLAGCAKSALLASAFEALLFEVVFKPASVTASVLQTIAQAVDCLGRLFQNGDNGAAGLSLKAKILIVDDDAVCNYTMVAALKRAHFEPVSVEDPNVAVQMAQATRYDIVLLDINMPGMNGFQLCEALRRMPQYKETPVIFITGNGDFQNRAQGILSGGNDLITKPTSPLELVLKTTMHLLQPQGRRPEPTAAAAAQQRLDAPPVAPQAAPPVQQNGQSQNSLPQNGSSEKPVPQNVAPQNGSPQDSSPQNVAPQNVAPQNVEAKLEQPQIQTGSNVASDTPPAPVEATQSPQTEGHIEVPMPEQQSEMVPSEAGNGSVQPEPPQVKNGSTVPEIPNDTPPSSQPIPLAKQMAMQRNSQPNNDNSNLKLNMETTNKPAFDEIAQGVARIIFGDENITEMNVRLTRIALERYNVPQMQGFDEIAQVVARIIFGDENITEMNVRLTRIALERYKVSEVLRPADSNGSSGSVSRLSSVSL